jgi:hypothetical protein
VDFKGGDHAGIRRIRPVAKRTAEASPRSVNYTLIDKLGLLGFGGNFPQSQ